MASKRKIPAAGADGKRGGDKASGNDRTGDKQAGGGKRPDAKQQAGAGFRTEHDSMGELSVPAQALWGAQTQRAVQNFPISGVPMPREFIRALALDKGAAAEVKKAA